MADHSSATEPTATEPTATEPTPTEAVTVVEQAAAAIVSSPEAPEAVLDVFPSDDEADEDNDNGDADATSASGDHQQDKHDISHNENLVIPSDPMADSAAGPRPKSLTQSGVVPRARLHWVSDLPHGKRVRQSKLRSLRSIRSTQQPSARGAQSTTTATLLAMITDLRSQLMRSLSAQQQLRQRLQDASQDRIAGPSPSLSPELPPDHVATASSQEDENPGNNSMGRDAGSKAVDGATTPLQSRPPRPKSLTRARSSEQSDGLPFGAQSPSQAFAEALKQQLEEAERSSKSPPKLSADAAPRVNQCTISTQTDLTAGYAGAESESDLLNAELDRMRMWRQRLRLRVVEEVDAADRLWRQRYLQGHRARGGSPTGKLKSYASDFSPSAGGRGVHHHHQFGEVALWSGSTSLGIGRPRGSSAGTDVEVAPWYRLSRGITALESNLRVDPWRPMGHAIESAAQGLLFKRAWRHFPPTAADDRPHRAPCWSLRWCFLDTARQRLCLLQNRPRPSPLLAQGGDATDIGPELHTADAPSAAPSPELLTQDALNLSDVEDVAVVPYCAAGGCIVHHTAPSPLPIGAFLQIRCRRPLKPISGAASAVPNATDAGKGSSAASVDTAAITAYSTFTFGVADTAEAAVWQEAIYAARSPIAGPADPAAAPSVRSVFAPTPAKAGATQDPRAASSPPGRGMLTPAPTPARPGGGGLTSPIHAVLHRLAKRDSSTAPNVAVLKHCRKGTKRVSQSRHSTNRGPLLRTTAYRLTPSLALSYTMHFNFPFESSI